MAGGLILVIGIVILVMRGMGRYERPADRYSEASARQEPVDIPRARFARGEITEAEFEQAKRTLGGGPVRVRSLGWLGPAW
ncbi:MAG: SHOCT domain-containing protein [Candidatus Limnocylindrales bacterium]